MKEILLHQRVKPFIDWFFVIFKSIWKSTLSVLTLIVYAFLLHALVTFYELDTTTIKTLFILTDLLISKWGLWWLIFFGSSIWDEYKWSRGKRNE